MRYTRTLINTVRDAPADAGNTSNALLVRGGYIRKVGAGLFEFLPLGLRVLRKVENVVRDEMDRAGALEILMPALLPAEYFQETGRWDLYGDTLFRLKDRKGGDFHLGPTHEEIVTDIARHEVKSWRDLPKTLYQIQSKYRDEPRPRGGLLRGREFSMKDAYSFDADEESARASYDTMKDAYGRIFSRMGLTFRMVAADPGAIGGSTSAEFQILADSGEDAIVACDTCDYAANVEVATVRTAAHEAGATGQGQASLEKVSTPNVGSMEAVSAFLRQPKERFLKSLLFTAGKDVVLAVVRGDHDVNQVLLARLLGVDEVFLASDADVRKHTGAKVGFAGPVGFQGRVIADCEAASVRDAVTGANETDAHFVGVNHGRDWSGEVASLRLATTGDPCPRCDKGSFKSYRGIEGGHIFLLGTRYSAAMGADYLDEKQQKRTIVMGCYGIGVTRLIASAIEQNHDSAGIRWPIALAPYHVHLVTLGKDEAVLAAGKSLHDELSSRGIEVLWDDRDERPGVKFIDADLLGMPLRITIGAKTLAGGSVEMKARSEPDPKKVELVPAASAANVIASWVEKAVAGTRSG